MGIIHPTQIVACGKCGIIFWRNADKVTNNDRCPICGSLKYHTWLDWKELVKNSKR